MDEPFDILLRAVALHEQGVPFALATVTLSERPTSALAGAKAIVMADGSLIGWVGGACAQPSVVAHALEALRSGEPRHVRISPQPGAGRAGIIELAMTCHSGGTLEVFIEPMLPAPYLVVVGDSPIARALLALGKQVGFRTVAMTAAGGADEVYEDLAFDRLTPGRAAYVVVASMGDIDELALSAALATSPAYIALVGSRRRFAAIVDYLRAGGISEERIGAIRSPAGLDIHAVTPAEVALSVLAEIVHLRRTRDSSVGQETSVGATSRIVVDPICGMSVDLSTAKHILVIDGVTYGFCCAGCLRAFERERATASAPDKSGLPFG